MTFHQFTRQHKCTYDEKDSLAWQLAQMRARSIYRQLRPQPRYNRKAVAP